MRIPLFHRVFFCCLTVVLSACGGPDFRKTILSGETSATLENINEHTDVDAVDFEGFRPIHYAAYKGDIAVIERLVENGASYDLPSMRGTNALVHAIDNRQSAATEYLLSEGSSLESASMGAISPLMVAASKGGAELVVNLVGRGADIDYVAADGASALFASVLFGHENIALYLIDKGADMTLTTRYGWSVLHAAAFRGSRSLFAVIVENSGIGASGRISMPLSLPNDGYGESSLASARANHFMGDIASSTGYRDAARGYYKKAIDEYGVAAQQFDVSAKELIAASSNAAAKDGAQAPIAVAGILFPVLLIPAIVTMGNSANEILEDQMTASLSMVPDISKERFRSFQREGSLKKAADVFASGATSASTAQADVTELVECLNRNVENSITCR